MIYSEMPRDTEEDEVFDPAPDRVGKRGGAAGPRNAAEEDEVFDPAPARVGKRAAPASPLNAAEEDEATRQPEKRARLGTDKTERAKDGTVWHEEHVGARLHFTPVDAYIWDGEPTAEARRRITSRLQSFLCLVTLDTLRSIQGWTNQHGQQRECDWFTTVPELMAFISVVIFRGIIKVPSLSDSWSTDLGSPHITGTMTRQRFKDIMRHLRFDDGTNRSERAQTNKFAPISTVWGSFVYNCIKLYNPGQHLTVDEQLFPTKTKCAFQQYMASKPDKNGIKFWVACDVKTKYICNAFPYVGRDPHRPSGERLSENVVMKLMEPFLDKGRNVTTDNFFTSLSLAQRLLDRKTTILGTVNRIRREIPECAKQMHREQFSTQVFSTSGATLTVYAAKRTKTVYMLSTMHSVVDTDNTAKKKPTTVTQYNKTKCGVDVMDQMVRQYTVRKGTRRWPVAVFYNMIDMAALNAYVLYQACTGKKERRVDFLVGLAKELAQSHVGAQKALKEKLLRQQPATPGPGKRGWCQVKQSCNNNRASARCVHCYKYTCGKCKIETPLVCKKCK